MSGGGGWGAKKGLLSLDPQLTHFTPPDNEGHNPLLDMDRHLDFIPAGSSVQFFAACPLPPPVDQSDEISVLGVSGDYSGGLVGEDPALGRSVCGGFGATSDQCVFVNSKSDGAASDGNGKVKLSVPGSHLVLPAGM